MYLDFVTCYEDYNNNNFKDFVNSGKHSLYQGVYLVYYILIALLGNNTLLWFLLFSTLHAWLGTVVFHFFRTWLQLIKVPFNNFDLLLAVILFLLGPLSLEVVTWEACIHYIISAIILFYILSFLLNFYTTNKIKYLTFIYFLMFVSIFFLEYFYLTPFYILTISFSLCYQQQFDRQRFKNILFKIFAPTILILLIYFFLLNLTLNTSIGRVNDGILGNMTPYFIAERYAQFGLRLWCWEFLWPQQIRDTINSCINSNLFKTTFLVIIGISSIIIAKNYKKWPSLKKALVITLILTAISCVVILPMWYYDTFYFTGSRYFYIPSIFASLFVVLAIKTMINKEKLAYLILLVYLTINLSITLFLTYQIGYSSKINYALFDNFKWNNGKKVLLLNLPNMLNGIPMLESGNPSNFKDHYEILTGKSISSTVYDVSSYNMLHKYDGAHFIVEDSVTVKAVLNQMGSWWWEGGFGAKDYENDLYQFKLSPDAFSYTLFFKQPIDSNTILIYHVGPSWKILDMQKIGVEQW
jgi:hypothetical protein